MEGRTKVVIKVGERKERSDKKREVKPLIPLDVKDAIHRLSHVTHKPVKDVCEFLTVYILRDTATINTLSRHFKRSIQLGNTYYRGDINNPGVSKRLKVPSDHVSGKYKKNDFEIISTLAYALDCTPTRVNAILLESATRNIKAVNEYVHEYMTEELSDSQMRELRKVLSYVNQYNDDNSSWLSILSAVIGDIRPATTKLYELVEEFLKGK